MPRNFFRFSRATRVTSKQKLRKENLLPLESLFFSSKMFSPNAIFIWRRRFRAANKKVSSAEWLNTKFWFLRMESAMEWKFVFSRAEVDGKSSDK